MHMLFIDPVTPKPYSTETLRNQPLGGTEATVVRVAEYLDAIVVQHNRTENAGLIMFYVFLSFISVAHKYLFQSISFF